MRQTYSILTTQGGRGVKTRPKLPYTQSQIMVAGAFIVYVNMSPTVLYAKRIIVHLFGCNLTGI